MRVVDSKKRAQPLRTPAREAFDFRPLQISPQMQAAYDRCDPRPLHSLGRSTVPLHVEKARATAGANGEAAPQAMLAPIDTPAFRSTTEGISD